MRYAERARERAPDSAGAIECKIVEARTAVVDGLAAGCGGKSNIA